MRKRSHSRFGVAETWFALAGCGLASGSLVACGPAVGSPPPNPPVESARPTPLGYVPADAPPSQATDQQYEHPSIPAIDDLGCTFSIATWKRARTALALRLSTDVKPWGELPPGADVEVTLALAEDVSLARIEVNDSKVDLAAIVEPSDVILRSQKATMVEGFAVPLPSRPLAATRFENGRAALRFDFGAQFSPARFHTVWPCADLGLDAVRPSPELLDADPIGSAMMLEANQRVALSSTPTGPIVTHITPNGPITVDVIARKGTMIRVRWVADETMFVPWIDTTSVKDSSDEATYAINTWGVGSGAPTSSGSVACREALPLIVWQRGVARTVGKIHAATAFEPSVRLGSLVAIEVAGAGVRLTDGSFYTIAARIPKACSPP